jgi:hypothetical protein
VPSTYHLVTLDGTTPVDEVMPGDGWGVLGMDASDAPMVTRWSENGIAWRRALGGVWQTTSWAVPPSNGSFSSHEDVGGVKPHGLWVLGGDGVVAVVYEPKDGGTRLVRAVDAPRPGT